MSSAISACRTFSASFSSVLMWVTTYTAPMPPLPRSCSTRYRPAMIRPGASSARSAIDHQRSRLLRQDRIAVREADRGFEAEIRLGRMALGLEDREIVGRALNNIQHCGERIEADGDRLRRVHAPEIHSQLLVDEDEHVVVAGELEDLTTLVRELRVELE